MDPEIGGETALDRSGYSEVEETLERAPEKLQVEYDIEKGATVFSGEIIRMLDQAPRKFRENHIFRVDDVIRKGHENHYEPTLLAIGPYHRGKSNLQPMEEHKLQCLNRMIEHAVEDTGISRCDLIKRCYEVLKGVEDEARGYYADDTTGLDSGEFLKMLLLDGCFLLEYLQGEGDCGEDPFMNMPQIQRIIQHDVLFLENQLPFFILEKLADVMTTGDNDKKTSSGLLTLAMLSILQFVIHSIRPVALAFQDVASILISVYKLYGNEEGADEIREKMKPYVTDIAVLGNGREIDPEKLKNTKHLLEVIYKVLLKEDILEMPVATSTTIDIFNEARYNTYSVTELSNAGVKFKSVDKQKFYGIEFNNGTLEIPKIRITRNTTEGLFRNLMLYEAGVDEETYIINDYVNFMDSLISSGKDVELLRIQGIIEHYLGDDEAVSTMFNSIGAISERSYKYYYSDIVKKLKHHCEKRQNVWMAKLRSDYFSSPWTIISVIAAFVLIVLTIIQTIYSPLSYYNS